MKIRILALSLALSLTSAASLRADNFRVISNAEGISNNAVLSVCQDNAGYIWMGTCDGLNRWDGSSIRVYPYDWEGAEDLSGNFIDTIIKTLDGKFIIRSNYGIDLFDPCSLELKKHPEMTGRRRIAAGDSGHILVFSDGGLVWSYDATGDRFCRLNEPPEYSLFKILSAGISENEVLTLVQEDKGIARYKISGDGADLKFIQIDTLSVPSGAAASFNDDGKVLITARDGTVYEYVPGNAKLSYIFNIASDVYLRGLPTSMVRDGDDIVLAFPTSGVMRLRYEPGIQEHYVPEATGVTSGIFSIIRDIRQDIVWAGSDGNGLIKLYRSEYDFKSYSYKDFHDAITMPVRSIFRDRQGSLWFGTKGDGLFRIENYDSSLPAKMLKLENFNTINSGLSESSVYAFAPSSRNLLWVGNNGGSLNYYSYEDNRLHTLSSEGRFDRVHVLYESAPDTLWIASAGAGIYMAELSGGDYPQFREIHKIDLGEEFSGDQLFFAMHPQGKQIMWFGSRGEGAARYDVQSGITEAFDFGALGKAIYNDVFAITDDGKGSVWFGTGDGVIRMGDNGGRPETVEGINGAIHAIIYDGEGSVWASGNGALYRISVDGNIVKRYDQSSGLDMVEFSDGAVFMDEDGALFFGGVSGIVRMERTGYVYSFTHPDIEFNEMTVNGKNSTVSAFLHGDKIKLKHNQILTSLRFGAVDYINGNDYVFKARIRGYFDKWREIGSEIEFADLKPGLYNVEVMYKDNSSGYKSPVSHLKIRIKAPWYLSVLAKIVYVLLLAGLAALQVNRIFRSHRRRKAERQKAIEEENNRLRQRSMHNVMYGIADELSVPITLINGYSQMILSRGLRDGKTEHDVNDIIHNTIRLKNLSNMLRNVCDENGGGRIELVDMSEMAETVIHPFVEVAAGNSYGISVNIRPMLAWAVNRNSELIALNIVADFITRNTLPGGKISFSLDVEDNVLVARAVSDRLSIRYDTIREVLESDSLYDYFGLKDGNYGSEEFNIAICKELAGQSGGTVAVVKGESPEIALEIRIPKSKVQVEAAADNEPDNVVEEFSPAARRNTAREQVFAVEKLTVMVVNEGDEVSSFIVNALWDEYNIMAPDSIQEAELMLQENHPDLMICGGNGAVTSAVKFMNEVKGRNTTRHIPLILVLSRQTMETVGPDRSKADACILIPFELDNLKMLIKQLLNRNDVLKDYYKSPISNYKLFEGKVIHSQDKEFIDRMFGIISANVANKELSPEFIASEMCLSVRNLYRKIENILDVKPSSLIKDYRLSMAAELLETSRMTVDEIIYKTGFINRGTFFKLFTAKYGTTPKKYMKSKQVNADAIQDN